MTTTNVLKKIEESLAFIFQKTSLKPTLGITLGSGLAAFAEAVDEPIAISYADIPHFSPPGVDGHPGQLILGKICDLPVAVLQGRIHYYEGHSMEEVVFPTRVLGKMGVQTQILTNAAGGLAPYMQPGDFMIITDHINLTGASPLRGPNIKELGPRFPDMSRLYDPRLNSVLAQQCIDLGLRYSDGVYCGVAGPAYETAAEVKYLQTIGGKAVGMSTVAETIAARHMGVKVCGISCITNLATGLSDQVVSHEDVKDVAKKVESNFAQLLTRFMAEAKDFLGA